MSKRFICAALMTALTAFPALASLTEKEQQAVDHIASTQGDAVALLKSLVSENSGTMNFDGIRKNAHMMIPEFTALGFDARFISGEKFDRAGHLIATKEGGKGPNILLIGHLDTVFAKDSPFQSFTMLDNGLATGPGISDMKGGNVIILQALKGLKAAGELDDMNIRVVMTGDEESSGRPLSLSKAALTEAAEWADVALGFEDGDGDPATANTARRGAMGWELTVTGVPAHSSQVFQPDIGAGAIYESARILHSFYTNLRGEKLLTFNPGKIVGGTEVSMDEKASRGTAFGKDNVVAETTRVTGDIRTISMEQLDQTQATMREIVADNLPQTSAEIAFDDGYPPMAPTEGNTQLLSMYSAISEALDQGKVTAVDPRNAGAADISFTATSVDMALDGLGMKGTGGHTVKETGDINSLTSQAQRAALLMYRLKTAN